MQQGWRSRNLCASIVGFVMLIGACPAFAEPLPFRKAIELALQHSGVMVTAAVDRDKSRLTYKELRAAFLPQLNVGSGLGYSRGIPPSIGGAPPSLFTLSSQQFALNLSQVNFVHAANSDLRASQMNYADKANQVILDTALLYVELDSLDRRLKSLREEQQQASRVTFISSERVKQGLDSPLDFKRAQLVAARVEMRIAEVETSEQVLREQLARTLGVPPDSIETASATVPETPEVPQDRDAMRAALETSAAVRVADEKIKAAEFRAKAERQQSLPSIDVASQYQLLTSFNHYDLYYTNFTQNNFTIGASFRFPFLNFAQRARSQAAAVEVVRARNEAKDVRGKVSDEALRLQRSLRQLEASVQVSRLEYEVANANIDTMQAHLTTGQANSRDLESARLDATDRFVLYLQSEFELQKAKLQLLRQTGELQGWAMAPKP